MRIFAILALLLGVALAGGAVKYMYGQFQHMQALYESNKLKEPIKTVMIAVAKEDLRFGKKIGPDSIRLVEWPAEAAPANAFNTIEDLFDGPNKQRTVLRQIEVGEAILKSKVTGFGEDANVAALLKPGMRAHTLGVDSKSSVAGFLFPGSQVDIYLTYKGAGGQRTKLLMEGADIIAVDQTTDPDKFKAQVARTVTLEVTPEDSQRLILADRVGQLSFNLRGMGESEPVSSADGGVQTDLSVAKLLGIKVEEAEKVQPKDKVVVRRGGFIQGSIEVTPTEEEKLAEEEKKRLAEEEKTGVEKTEPASN